MESDILRKQRFEQVLGQNLNPSGLTRNVAEWISKGGVAANGIRYAAPPRAIAWGQTGCPLLPRGVREHNLGVTLPSNLQCLFREPLTVGQLKPDVLEQHSNDGAWQHPPREFRDFLYSMPILPWEVAIPAGIPLAWFENLPITGRTRSAVRKAFRRIEPGGNLDVPLLAHQFVEFRNVGLTMVNELMCVIESAELGWSEEGPTATTLEDVTFPQEADGHDLVDDAETTQKMEEVSSFSKRLYEYLRWALSESDSKTFGGATANGLRGTAEKELWEPLAVVELKKLVEHPPHPYKVLDNWVEQLDDRQRAIYWGRFACHPDEATTLEKLGIKFGVTRERIRQIEVKVHRSLRRFKASNKASIVGWRVSTLRRELSVAAPEHVVEHLLAAPPGCQDHRHVLLELAGPYDHDQDWLILRSAKADDPTSAILAEADEVGRIDGEAASRRLTEWGLGASFHDSWLARIPAVRLFRGQLVRWGASISDRFAFALADMARPATIEEMVAHITERRSKYSISNALSGDPRLIRISRTHWALADWDLAEYSTIAQSMRQLIEQYGQPMEMETLVYRMTEYFGTLERSTLHYSGAPMFIVEGNLIRLRTEKDGPYQYTPNLTKRTAGIFRLGRMKVGRLLKVDKDMLRGSGTLLTHAGGSILGVEVNSHLVFENECGDKVTITFPETSAMGPNIGSLRQIAERLPTKEGDNLTLVLDRSNMSMTAHSTDLRVQSPEWGVVASLTGIGSPLDLNILANSLDCSVGEVRSVLRARSDDLVLDFLPKPGPSTDLDYALAELQDQLATKQTLH